MENAKNNLKEAALKFGEVTKQHSNEIVNPLNMVGCAVGGA